MPEFFQTDVGKVALGGLIAIAGSVLPPFIGWLKDWRADYKSRRRNAEYLAMHVVIVFENFLGALYDAVHDPMVIDPEGTTHAYQPDPKLVMPSNVDYQSLPAPLMYRVLSIPNDLASIQKGLDFWSVEASSPDRPEYFDYRREEYAKLGLKVTALIDDLCRKYEIPQPERIEHYDPKSSLERELIKAREREIERQKSAAEVMDRMKTKDTTQGQADGEVQ